MKKTSKIKPASQSLNVIAEQLCGTIFGVESPERTAQIKTWQAIQDGLNQDVTEGMSKAGKNQLGSNMAKINENLTEFSQADKEQQPVTHEAHALINGPRRTAYGSKGESFARIGIGWGCVLHARGLTASSAPIPGDVVALMMTWFKTVREAKKHQRDNCVDGAAYFELAHEVAEEIEVGKEGAK